MMDDTNLTPNMQRQLALQKRHEEYLRELGKANAKARKRATQRQAERDAAHEASAERKGTE